MHFTTHYSLLTTHHCLVPQYSPKQPLPRGRLDLFAHGGGELLEEGALVGGELGGDLDLDEDVLVAAAAAAKIRDALAAQHKLLAALRAFRDLDLLRAADDRDLDV